MTANCRDCESYRWRNVQFSRTGFVTLPWCVKADRHRLLGPSWVGICGLFERKSAPGKLTKAG